MGPIEASKPWSASGVDGARKFVDRVWRFFTNMENITDSNDGSLDKAYNSMVKRVTNDFETLGFNTAISQFRQMEKRILLSFLSGQFRYRTQKNKLLSFSVLFDEFSDFSVKQS